MLTGNETLRELVYRYPELIEEFGKYSLGHFFSPESLRATGDYTHLNSLLQTANIDAALFIDALNEIELHRSIQGLPAQASDFMAMLPCGLRNAFKIHLEKQLDAFPERYGEFHYKAEGNVNHELSFYPQIDHLQTIDELPDLVLSSDVNNFFHRPFRDKFIDHGLFGAYEPYPANPYLADAGFCDPDHHYSMFTANMLVMAVDKTKLGDHPMPRYWADLLSKDFNKAIIMRGEADFFCNAILLPFYKDHGMEAIRMLANNIRSGKHPAEMVKLANSTLRQEGAAIYILPYFFATKIKNKNVEVVWPQDGAIASPVFLLVKQKALERHRAFLAFLFSEETAKMLVSHLFPSLYPKIAIPFPQPLKWLGWDFLKHEDIGQLKQAIQQTFQQHRAQD